ncbi:MAG TPA: phosphoribosyl-AMP cyclohydrolase [Methanocorpusculum sp.]|nr:phosphoribosyl-AMP cyclohydrolase [Methanocorpusculum sp.]
MSSLISSIKYNDACLVPVVVQDVVSKDVLMFAWANEEAVLLTVESGFAHYFSRSRGKLWKKGEESGHLQRVSEVLVDCDCDTLLYLVEQEGCACHEGYRSCFFRRIDGEVVLERLKKPEEIYGK